MTTPTRARPTRGEVLRALWCIRDVRDPAARRIAHLVDLDQPARPGGARDALCGRPAAKWRRIDHVDTIGVGIGHCPDCSDVSSAVTDGAPAAARRVAHPVDLTTPPPDPRPAPGPRLPGPTLPLGRAGQVWHAATALDGSPLVAHLLPNSWEARPGGSRPSLCGLERRRSWQPVEQFSVPENFARCPDCEQLAQPAQPSGPRHDPIGCTPAPPPEANSQAARVARRVAFRNVVAIDPAALDYQPAGNYRRPPSWRQAATT